MLEMLINPRKAERKPWELFFVGFFYASLSFLMVNWIFSADEVLSRYSGILIVTFTVMFSLPFIYFTVRLEESKITPRSGTFNLIISHRRAVYAFMFLFLGFVFAYSLFYILSPSSNSFSAQIETYCKINRPSTFDDCVRQYGLNSNNVPTGSSVNNSSRFMLIFFNNIYVLIFTLIFSLILGAGSIFILAWNASVIAAAIGIFTKSDLSAIPLAFLRYMLHGIPEIMSYFIVALAGGLISVAVIKHESGTEKFWEVLLDSLNLIILAIVILFLAAGIEVFITPLLF